jgi:carboxypeptidase Q
MSWRQVQYFIYFLVLFLSAAFCDIADNAIEHYAIQSETGETVCKLPDNLKAEIASYQGIVNRIAKEITEGKFKDKTFDALAELTDTFGPRMTCTPALENAIDYVVENMKKAGLENIHTENASVPYWTRGFESAQLVSPWKKNLKLLGLGSSIGTPRGGIIADVVAYESFEEFKNVSEDEVKGKIVVFVPKWQGYGETVVYRSDAASIASRKGAVAALVRSITPFSIGSPHTGHQNYADDVNSCSCHNC